MITKRIIPCLDVRNGRVVKGVNFEGLSDVLQWASYKFRNKKRIFKMAPIHHHFEQCGWSELKIVSVASVITLILCIVAYFGIA